MYYETTEQLLKFIKESPTAFHAVEAMSRRLREHDYTELREQDRWELQPGGKYFVTRNHSSLIAFAIPQGGAGAFRIMASHSDSPAFKIKENPEMDVKGVYVRLNVEGYGGMLMAPWFDRPLSVAGRVIVEDADGGLQERLVCVDRDLLMIPSLAIHMNRDVNKGYEYNIQRDLLPLYGQEDAKGTFWEMIAGEAGTSPEAILGHDLFLYSRTPGTVWGAHREFVSSGRLDDLQCAYASLEGFLAGRKERYVAVHCVLDNEEVGSETKQGAASTFLQDVLLRISLGTGRTYEDYLTALAGSFMVSADNAHAVHPNYADKTDPVNHPQMNRGIVIKYNAAQKYCTDAVSAAQFRQICRSAGVPFQTFVNRSDIPGGSTQGSIANTHVSVSTADIGLPQLAMHSPYETAGVKDTEYLIRAAQELFA